jgi:hypothetical protein
MSSWLAEHGEYMMIHRKMKVIDEEQLEKKQFDDEEYKFWVSKSKKQKRDLGSRIERMECWHFRVLVRFCVFTFLRFDVSAFGFFNNTYPLF